jgi:chromosome segregation ATPase
MIKEYLFGKTTKALAEKEAELERFEASLNDTRIFLYDKEEELNNMLADNEAKFEAIAKEQAKKEADLRIANKALEEKQQELFFKEFEFKDEMLKIEKERQHEYDIMVKAVNDKDEELNAKSEELEKFEQELKAFEAELNVVKEEKKVRIRSKEMIVDEFGNFKGFK